MYRYGPMPAPVMERPNIAQGIAQNVMAISQMQRSDVQNKLLQEEISKREGVKQALKGYGQQGFDMEKAVTALMPVDPEMAIKVKESLRRSSKEQVELLGAGAKLTEQYAPMMMDNPAAYVQYYNTMSQMGLSGPLPHPQSFITEDGKAFDTPKYNQALKNIVGLKDIIKSELEGPKPPQTRDVKRGEQIVTEEWDKTTGAWKEIGTAPRWDPQASGMRIVEHPDGTKEYVMGRGGAQQTMSGLPKKTEGELYEKLTGHLEDQAELQKIKQTFQSKLQTYGGQIRGQILDIWGKIDPGSLNDEQKTFLNEFSAHRANTGRLMSNMLKRLSGAAVTKPEQERAETYIPKAGQGWFDGDSPARFEEKLKQFEEFNYAAIDRHKHWLRNGIDISGKNLDKEADRLPLSKMPDIIKTRAQAITAELKGQGMSNDQIANELRKRINAEFGGM